MTTIPQPSAARGTGAILLVTGLLQILLLALHPETSAHDFAGVLREEAAERTMDALVHGGFIVLLGIQLVCYAILSVRLDATHAAAIAGLAFFAIGSAFLMASLMIDGLIVPGIAARYAAAGAEKQESVRGIFAFAGVAISWLMPMGLVFQGGGIAAWGLRLLAFSKPAGLVAVLLALATAAGPVAAAALAKPLLLMIALVGPVLWTMTAAAWLMRRDNRQALRGRM